MDKIEYRVRPVTRYIVTRFEESADGRSGASTTHGEYDNADMAHAVGYALCKAEHDRLGWPPGDDRITYPRRSPEAVPVALARPGEIPRCAFMPQWAPAERAIFAAIQEVEKMPADTRLTAAVVLLGEAQSEVANFVDGAEGKTAA